MNGYPEYSFRNITEYFFFLLQLQDRLIDINGIKLKEDEELYDLLKRINEDLEINVMRNVVVKKDDNDKAADKSSSVTTALYRVLISLSVCFQFFFFNFHQSIYSDS